MKTDWLVELNAAGRGLVQHLAAPPFTAFWTSGEDAPTPFQAPCWTCPGSGPEDSIHLFGWTWGGPEPDGPELECLLTQAATAIDDWISNQL